MVSVKRYPAIEIKKRVTQKARSTEIFLSRLSKSDRVKTELQKLYPGKLIKDSSITKLIGSENCIKK